MSRSIDALALGLEKLLGLALIVAVLFNFVNVVGRYIFGSTFISADEVQIFIMVYIAFLGAAVATWRRMHLRMDVLVNRLPRRLKAVLGALELLLVATLAGLVLYVSSGYVAQMAGLDARSQNAGIPMWVPHSAIVLGFGLIAVLAILQLIQLFRNGDAP
ncbi:MAG TPA: TRAP transporter small permease [Burkholderiales bacterium]|nr:TRAP transporter small permease [Burkholderiales bacterium]